MNEEMKKYIEMAYEYAKLKTQVEILRRLSNDRTYIDHDTIVVIFGGEENDVRGTAKSE